MTKLDALKRRAKSHGLIILHTGNGFALIGIRTSKIAAYPQAMTLEQVNRWLDDLDDRRDLIGD